MLAAGARRLPLLPRHARSNQCKHASSAQNSDHPIISSVSCLHADAKCSVPSVWVSDGASSWIELIHKLNLSPQKCCSTKFCFAVSTCSSFMLAYYSLHVHNSDYATIGYSLHMLNTVLTKKAETVQSEVWTTENKHDGHRTITAVCSRRGIAIIAFHFTAARLKFTHVTLSPSDGCPRRVRNCIQIIASPMVTCSLRSRSFRSHHDHGLKISGIPVRVTG